jgi:hypothetical protein
MEMCSCALLVRGFWSTRLGCEETRSEAGSSEGQKKFRKEDHASPTPIVLDVQQTILIFEAVFIVAVSQHGM